MINYWGCNCASFDGSFGKARKDYLNCVKNYLDTTADRVFSSAANSSRLIPATNLWARFAACKISSKAASSRGIPRLGGVENLGATNPVGAALNGPAIHHIHATPQQLGELIAHAHVVDSVQWAPSAKVTRTSMSLSVRKSSRNTEPNSSSRVILQRRQNSANAVGL